MNLTLNKHEIKSFERGNLIVSDEQNAVCYLLAKEAIKGKYPNFKLKTTIDNIAIECGMNTETLRRSVNKFTLLITGKDDDAEEVAKEAIFPKIRNAYNRFQELNINDVYDIANLSFTEENKKIGLLTDDKRATNSIQSSEQYKLKDKEIQLKVISLYRSLYNVFKDESKSKRQAISKTVKELEVSETRVLNIWNKDSFLKQIK